MTESVNWTGVDSLIRAMSLLGHECKHHIYKQNINEHETVTAAQQSTLQDEGKWLSLPDSVRVPLLMDDDLGGADGDGTSLIVLQIVFSQIDSVGATAAWPQNAKKHGSELL